jgi:hypothetical protein
LSNLNFELEPVEKKPRRRYRKGSKYNPIIDAFVKGEHSLVKVDIPDKDANYIRIQLKKRIDVLDMNDNIAVSVVNGVAYLEKK